MKLIKTNKFFLLLLISLFTLNCNDDDTNLVDCPQSDKSIGKFEMRKAKQFCHEIDLLWEISFGVALEWEIELLCGSVCGDWDVLYEERISRKHKNGTEDYGATSSAIINCNENLLRSMTLNVDVNDLNPREYEVGDTLVFEYINPHICKSKEPLGCDSDQFPIDLPDQYFEYIITQDDFDCN